MADHMEDQENKKIVKLSSSLPSSPTISYDSDPDDNNDKDAPFCPPWKKQRRNARKRRALSKQLSMRETRVTPRDVAWEKRRKQIIMRQDRKKGGDEITDGDLNELKGSIELGFGFKEEEGLRLCHTLPALDLYFAVNRQLSLSPASTPKSGGGSTSSSTPASSIGRRSPSFDSPKSDSETWKICSPGDNPQLVKNKLRLWAQAVACSVKQSF